jgi:LAO/AO transport system kinase
MCTSPSWARILVPWPIQDHGVLADLEGHARAHEGEAVRLQAPAEAQLQPRQAHEQARVVGREHAVRTHPAQQYERAAVARLGLSAHVRRQPGDPWRCDDRCHGRKGSLRGSMAEESLAQRLLAGDKRALARAITLVESDDPAGWELVREVYPKTGDAVVIGLTGAPGAGKSTLIGALIRLRRAADREVAVLSIDPSSPFTHGALLGDRIRLTEHFLDPGVFIRSMANRGALGGLSEAALQAALLMDAAGKDDVFLETVGVGQAEVDVIDHADTVVLVLMPGSGDSVQALKAGIMEIPDIIVVNKADHPLTDTMVREIRGVLSLAPQRGWRVPIVKTEAVRGEGVEALVEQLEAHRSFIVEEGTLSERRRRNLRNEVLALCTFRLRRRLEERLAEDEEFTALLDQVVARRLDPASAASTILERFDAGEAA